MYHTDKKENSDMQKLQGELETKYGPAVAQDIIDHMRTTNAPCTPDYMDVKAMSELQEKFRAQAMLAVWRLKEWRKAQTKKTADRNLIVLEGAFLRRQCEDSLKLYRHATGSYHRMYRDAMAAFTADKTPFYTAIENRA